MAIIAHDRPIPDGFATDDYLVRTLTMDDVAADHEAVMDTAETLHLWEQSTWPVEGFTVEDNAVDLAEMVERHQARQAYSYTVTTPDGSSCLGCVYLFAPDASFLAKSAVTPLGDAAWDDQQAAAYFWVRRPLIGSGVDADLLARLRTWLRDDWGLDRVVVVVSRTFTQQLELVRGTDLEPLFEVKEPHKDGTYLAFG